MGVPKFFRWISERYPCLSELVRENQIPVFDNLYLDMNGIIHNCSHPDDSNIHFRISEENMFNDIFSYIDNLFFLIKPQKLFFMAVDGVAPRAKMNQQRGRRFRSAKEVESQAKLAEEKGELLPDEPRFDSNAITPGTEFMERLQVALTHYVNERMSSNKLWQKCRVILSGHNTPGEGEHKIMEYIRFLKSQEDYDPNTRTCLYGLDADLIILGLCTHEAYFSLLREEVKFGRKQKKSARQEIRFYLLHLGLLKEYLELEFFSLKNHPSFDIDRIIDDWILMGFLVGNDFIPNLPNLHINDDALPILYKTYIKTFPSLQGYINEFGRLNLQRLEQFMEELAEFDKLHFQGTNSNLKYFEAKMSKEKTNDLEAFDFELSTNMSETFDFNPPNAHKTNQEELNSFAKSSELELFGSSDDPQSSDDDNLLEKEFIAHKRHYYQEKLGYDTVTPEVLAEQASTYVIGLQWILDYYYQGVSSWDWYYPHHYAPFASDVRNFSHLNIRFGLERPFLPFQQLLAVLPAASKELLPPAYRELMTHPNSRLKKYYPENFETDLNGKKQDWEAVVLIPFIDEKILLEEMHPCNEKLSAEERSRNSHKPMVEFRFSKKCLSTSILSDDLRKNIQLQKSAKRETIKYMPGFPTMKWLKYKSELRKEKVRVFDQPSRLENMILIPQDLEPVSLEMVANLYLNKTVYIGWPHLSRAKVVAVTNAKFIIDNSGISENNTNVFELQVRGLKQHHMNRMGVKYSDIEILLHCVTYLGTEYVPNSSGMASSKIIWNKTEICYPLQGIVSNIEEANEKSILRIEELFPVDSIVFVLSRPYFGCMGIVLNPHIVHRCGRLKISIRVFAEPNLEDAREIQKQIEASYYATADAALKVGITANILSRISGVVYVLPGAKRIVPQDTHKINVGMRLKYPKMNEAILGYTQKVGNIWRYSEKAIQSIRSYYEQFPQIFDHMSEVTTSTDVYFENEIFPDKDESEDLIQQVTDWLKDQNYNKADRVSCDSKLIEKQALDSVLKAVDESKRYPVKEIKLQVKPHLIYNPQYTCKTVRKPNRTLELFDRVLVIRDNCQVPVGSRGTVIGVQAVRDPNPVRFECVDVVETFYDVLFDKEFADGYELHDIGEKRVFRVSEFSILSQNADDHIDDNVILKVSKLSDRVPKGLLAIQKNGKLNEKHGSVKSVEESLVSPLNSLLIATNTENISLGVIKNEELTKTNHESKIKTLNSQQNTADVGSGSAENVPDVQAVEDIKAQFKTKQTRPPRTPRIAARFQNEQLG